MARAGAERSDRGGVETARLAQRAEHDRARSLGAHDIGRGRALPQRVEDEARDSGAILRAREAMRDAPVLERLGRRPTALGKFVEHFNRGGDMSGGSH